MYGRLKPIKICRISPLITGQYRILQNSAKKFQIPCIPVPLHICNSSSILGFRCQRKTFLYNSAFDHF